MITRLKKSIIILQTLIIYVTIAEKARSHYSWSVKNNSVAFGMPAPERLRQLLEAEIDGTRKDVKPILLPCCYDGLTARLVAKAGFEATFMTGFGE